MRKNDKKLENTIRKALTDVCEIALDQIDGFKWLTHTVNYDRFPESLTVICVFQSNHDLERARATKDDKLLRDLIKQHLRGVDVKLNDGRQHIRFDTEQACANENDGKWNERLG